MKNRLMTHADLDNLYTVHLIKVSEIWEEDRQRLYQLYLKEGYWEGFAITKANNEILRLRSKAENPHPMPNVPNDYPMGDLD